MRTMSRPTPLATLLAAIALPLLAWQAIDPVVQRAVDHENAHPAGDAAASFAKADYAGDLRNLPIGVFDSGVGGLTVLEALKTYDAHDNATGREVADGVPDFRDERFVYFGDQANMPYGNYPKSGKTPFLRELALKDAAFLLGRRWRTDAGAPPRMDKPPVKAIVIACNTATAYGLEDIRAAAKAWGIPVVTVGVVEAGARGVAETRGDRTGAIAVLATQATCASNAYPKAIAKLLPGTPAVAQQGSASLAAAIEGDPSVTESVGEIIDLEVKALLNHRMENTSNPPIDTLVLGCTHYPLVQTEIVDALRRYRKFFAADGSQPFRPLLAEQVLVVDPARYTAQDLWRALDAAELRLPAGAKPVADRDLFFISVANPSWPGVQLDADGGLTKDFKYGRDAGNPGREDTVIVPMTLEGLPKPTANLVRNRLPRVAESLGVPGKPPDGG
jgi:glutamate racemase